MRLFGVFGSFLKITLNLIKEEIKMNNLGKKIFLIMVLLLIGFNFIVADENSGQKNISIVGFVDREGLVVYVGIYSVQGDQLIASVL